MEYKPTVKRVCNNSIAVHAFSEDRRVGWKATRVRALAQYNQKRIGRIGFGIVNGFSRFGRVALAGFTLASLAWQLALV